MQQNRCAVAVQDVFSTGPAVGVTKTLGIQNANARHLGANASIVHHQRAPGSRSVEAVVAVGAVAAVEAMEAMVAVRAVGALDRQASCFRAGESIARIGVELVEVTSIRLTWAPTASKLVLIMSPQYQAVVLRLIMG